MSVGKLDVIPEEGASVTTPPPDEKGKEPEKTKLQEKQETKEPIVTISTEIVLGREEEAQGEKKLDLSETAQVEQPTEEPGERVNTGNLEWDPLFTLILIPDSR